MGLFFSRKKNRQQVAEPEPEPQHQQDETRSDDAVDELIQAAAANDATGETWTVEIVEDDPRDHYYSDMQRLIELDDGTTCARVRDTIYHQGNISMLEGDTAHVKPKMCVSRGERYYELYTEDRMILGYVSQYTLDRYKIATRGGIDVRVIRPESESGKYDVMIPVTPDGIENAERLEQLDVSFRLDEKWWCAMCVDDRSSFGNCLVLSRSDGSTKPQLYVACGSEILFTANSRMKAYPLLAERKAEVIRTLNVRAKESEYGTVYIVDLRY